jgi:predicted CopG family antitoxin
MKSTVQKYKTVAVKPAVYEKLCKLGDVRDTPSSVIERLITISRRRARH